MKNDMEKIWINTTSSTYPVLIGSGILDNISTLINNSGNPEKMLIICDKNTNKLFADAVSRILQRYKVQVLKYVMEPGEKSKTIDTYSRIIEYAAESELTRSDVIIALGGGVVGDIAGFVSGTYLRGIDFYQIPTTLLAAVDSSVGGKTGINLDKGKNLAGVFWQPRGVLCDMNSFRTLDQKEMSNGLAEIIKYGMLQDKELFYDLKPEKLDDILPATVKKCIEIKSIIVNADERDKGKRQLLNFGHTLGHALEKLSDYQISHGHAVSIGMSIVTKSSWISGICSEKVYSQLISKLKAFDLPIETQFSAEDIYMAAMKDKKRTGEVINMIVPEDIGRCRIYSMSIHELLNFVRKGTKR